jgi:DNA polymerase-3 subunit delta'
MTVSNAAAAGVWSSVAGAEASASLLQRDIASGRVAHAYLFGGVAGRLPLETALAFGAALVCPSGGCGTCDVCVRVVRSAHPDVEVIEPAGMQLLVDQVRDAVRAASRRPVASSRRVIIVVGADRMNPTAQNAFLKALEEPPPSTTIILLAPSPETLLETVRSRCREVTFRQPPPSEVAALLEAQGVDADDARYSARVGGDLQRAVTLARDGGARALRDEIVTLVLTSLRDPGEALEAAEWLAGRMREVRDRVAVEHKAEKEAFREWFNETKAIGDQRLRREQRRAEQDALETSIDDIASVLRDLVAVVHDPSANTLNETARVQLVERAAQLGDANEARIITCLGAIERARRRLRANANVLLTLEDIFLSLYRMQR